MAKPYKEGAGWAIRLRFMGQDIYLSGHKTAAAARKAAEAEKAKLNNAGKPAKLGPHRTCLAVAMQDYARERLPYLKGARQDAQRMNVYLRACNLPTIHLEELEAPQDDSKNKRLCYFNVTFQEEASRTVPNSLTRHRANQDAQRKVSDKIRRRLARTSVADITRDEIQALIEAMIKEGAGAATIGLERAQLRRVFSYAINSWRWALTNPAGAGLETPEIDNARDRVLSNSEWQRLSVHLAAYDNPYALPALELLLETAMRSSEPLVTATWGDVDWSRCILHLRDAKAGKRDVPLGPVAIEILKEVKAKSSTCTLNDQIFPTTYEALKKAWKFACKEARIANAKIHDLRHTSATRYSLELKGDIPLLQVITGHKTLSQLLRYVNVKADDVVNILHKRPLDDNNTPAGYTLHHDKGVNSKPELTPPTAAAPNVIRIDFGRRSA